MSSSQLLSKSLEGSLAFFISAVIVILIAPKVSRLPVEYVIGIIAAALGAVVEALPIRIDDNLTIPLAVGFSLWWLYMLFLPALDLTRLM
jgi:dolichol kinase